MKNNVILYIKHGKKLVKKLSNKKIYFKTNQYKVMMKMKKLGKKGMIMPNNTAYRNCLKKFYEKYTQIFK